METYAIHKGALVAPRKARMTMDLIRGKKATVSKGTEERSNLNRKAKR